MKITELHNWDMDVSSARELQGALACRILSSGCSKPPRLIAGIDVSVSRYEKQGQSAVVLMEFPSLNIVDIQTARGEIDFPYIPGLLSFREAPLILEACRKLQKRPDLLIVDGQGIAHPRRLGIASHIGLILDLPSIGCAKSRLIGHHNEVPRETGSCSPLVDGDECIGAAVRTKKDVKPVYISIGHRISLETAIQVISACCRGYRLPEPVRMAHLNAKFKTGDMPILK